MGIVVQLPKRHCAASAKEGSARKKASIGTERPVNSLSRLASPRDASLRPAQILRMCDSEQSTAFATAATVTPLPSAHRSNGCSSSDMAESISTRNGKSQTLKFLPEMECGPPALLQSGMAKRRKPEPEEIFLGLWLEAYGINKTQAAKIAGCGQPYISNISAGRRSNINALYLLRLSRAMNVTVNDLFQHPPGKESLKPWSNLSPLAQQSLMERYRKQA